MRITSSSPSNSRSARLPAAAVLALIGACSSSSNNNNNSSQCLTNALELYFTPMYSAFDGVHSFQIPAVVNGVDQTTSTWSSSDTSAVTIAKDPITGGAMITVTKAGVTTITAQIGDVCGTSQLTIDSATPDEWDAGNQRYHNGIPAESDAGSADGGHHGYNFNPQAACVNCHNADATPTPGSPFTAVSHTPEQAGGFSDTDLEGIFLNGNVPDGGYFDSTIVSQDEWHSFHQWQMTAEEQQGIIVYLRSLTPTPQSGAANFGGHGGGFYDGGHGGGGNNNDAGTGDGG